MALGHEQLADESPFFTKASTHVFDRVSSLLVPFCRHFSGGLDLLSMLITPNRFNFHMQPRYLLHLGE